MRSHLLFLPPIAALCLVGVVLLPASRSDADDLRQEPLVDRATMEAVDAGLRFLARTQTKSGPHRGAWTSTAGKKINESYRPFEGGVDIPHVGVTSLAVLAFLAGGHIPGRGPYGEVVDRAVEFVLGQVQPSGYIASHQTRMYSHAFATLALAEVYGVTRNPKVKARLQDALEFTVKCQNQTGGWRYVPFIQDSDMSVTVCQVVALRAARNVGLKVPRATIARALHYVILSANNGSDPRYPRGSFLYQPHTQEYNRESFALTAAGLTTIFQAGLYDNAAIRKYVADRKIPKRPPPNVDDIVAFMRRTYQGMPSRHRDHYFFWYGNYYAAQAMYQYGGQSGKREVWSDWYRMVRNDILRRQRTETSGPRGEREGWWISNVDRTHAYATASALLILQFPLDQLPIHQR